MGLRADFFPGGRDFCRKSAKSQKNRRLGEFPMAEAIEEPAISGHLSPPRWMSRPEKADFHRVIAARKAAGNPLSSTERDVLIDYVSVRSRIDALRRLFKKELADVGTDINFQRHVAGLARQIDSSTGLSRRLGRELQLTKTEKIDG
jgi:hypothetical protein